MELFDQFTTNLNDRLNETLATPDRSSSCSSGHVRRAGSMHEEGRKGGG